MAILRGLHKSGLLLSHRGSTRILDGMGLPPGRNGKHLDSEGFLKDIK